MAPRPEPLHLALAQMNATVGDLAGNSARIRELIARAREGGADLVVFPELALSGYPPEDLLLKRHFLEQAEDALGEIAAEAEGIVALVGYPERADDIYNSAAVLAGGAVAGTYRKMFLPNYGVFDEQRYFQVGASPTLIEIRGMAIGLTICEDIWEPGPPATTEALAGAQVIVNLSASPYHAGKGAERERMLVQRARDNLAAVAFANMVGGQDELVFDGHSVVIDQDGEILARGAQFAEELIFCAVDPAAAAAARLRDTRHRASVRRGRDEEGGGASSAQVAHIEVPDRVSAPPDGHEVEAPTAIGGPLADPMGPEEEVYSALVTGVRDYARKNGFEGVVLGLSGGIDSTLVALVAADAIGPHAVTCVVMPSPYSSQATQADARSLAANLGTSLVELPIEGPMRAFEDLLAEEFRGREPDITEENLQARIRGNLLMALSNKFGWLVLTTGNKSELSVGYATLYGDMAGGFAVLKDVFKAWVYRLVRWREARSDGELVPSSILERPPSAELRHDQRDDESLPPYEVLDAILAGYVELDLDARELEAQGLPAEETERVIGMVDRAEYKRRQAPPGIRISTKAFGRDRRLPITNRFRG